MIFTSCCKKCEKNDEKTLEYRIKLTDKYGIDVLKRQIAEARMIMKQLKDEQRNL